MTLQINGADVGAAIEIAIWAGGAILMLLAALVIYLMVRPPRKAAAQPEPGEMEEMLRLLERTEARLDALERSVGRRIEDRDDQGGEGRPQMRRIK